MKNVLLAFFILLLCTACPYESQVPISSKGDVFEEKLIGKWQRQDEGQNYYLVEKLDDKSYKISENAYNDETESFDVSLYKGHITIIKDYHFFSVTQYKPNEEASVSDEIMIASKATFYLYKLDLVNDDTFVMHPLSNYIKEEFDKSGALKKFIEKHMDLSFFYGEKESYIRITND